LQNEIQIAIVKTCENTIVQRLFAVFSYGWTIVKVVSAKLNLIAAGQKIVIFVLNFAANMQNIGPKLLIFESLKCNIDNGFGALIFRVIKSVPVFSKIIALRSKKVFCRQDKRNLSLIMANFADCSYSR
jgi:hypothetical protein